MDRRRLGEILVNDYRVPQAEIEAALGMQRAGERLGSLLVRQGLLTARDLVTALGSQLGVPVVLGLPRLRIPDEVIALVPMRMAERKLVIPVERLSFPGGSAVVLAMADPTDRGAILALRGLIGMEVFPAIAPEEEIRRALKIFYFNEPLHRDMEDVTGAYEAMRQRIHDERSRSLSIVPIAPLEFGTSTA